MSRFTRSHVLSAVLLALICVGCIPGTQGVSKVKKGGIPSAQEMTATALFTPADLGVG